MNQKTFFIITLLLSVLFSYISPVITLAQNDSASDSAEVPTLATLPSLFPTVTPTPTPIDSFPLLQQLNALATHPTATESAASQSGLLTPDIVASGSAQDFCLDVPVIMYHHTEPLTIATQLGHPQLTEDNNFFEEHIQYLTDHKYHFLSLSDLVHAIITRTQVSDKSVVITIDDGYIDNYTYAFLIAKKYHAIMNFMIPTGLIGQPDYMTWDHLKEMVTNPYARIYNHTTSHAPLGLINQDQIISEVTTANQQLESNLGIKNDIVVYPYGSYNDLAIQTLRQLGMIAAVSTDPGRNECLSNIYKLPRVRVGNEPIEDYGY